MNTLINEIKPGFGLGSIEFGLTRDELKKLIGKPSETELYNLSDEEGDGSEAWHFDELEMSVSFEEFFDWQLVSIAVSGEEFTLNGEKLIGKDKATVLGILEDMNLGDIEVDEDAEIDMFSIPELNINFWFEEDELSEIQWGPLFSDDDLEDDEE